MMELREHLAQVLESIGEHPGRVVASSLGVFSGTAALIVLLAWGAGFHGHMVSELSGFGRPMLFLLSGVTSSGFPGYRSGVRIEIPRRDIEFAEQTNTDLVVAVLAEHLSADNARLIVEARGRVRRMDLRGVDARYGELRNFRVGSGRFFQPADADRRRPVAVLGWEAAEELFGAAREAVGQRIRIEGHPFEVVGIADPKGRQYFNSNRPDNRLVMVPVTTAEARLGFDEERIERAIIFPRPGVAPKAALEAVVAAIAARRGFNPEDTDAVRWFDLTTLLGMLDLMYVGFLVFIGVAGTVTLLIAGVGIANFQIATLAERTAEIGLAKALGAHDRTLVGQTILESLVVSGTAAALGAATGLGVCSAIAAFAPRNVFPIPVIAPALIMITCAALIGVAVVASAIPALRLRRMDAALALRADG
jgi:putative ABC transport system permease protein